MAKKTALLALTVCMMLMPTIASAEEIYERAFQLGFITPLGTNGRFSSQSINTISINVLGGYSYGNTAFEFGGLYNINTHMTRGIQFAGISNYSGNADNAVQFAGITNIAAKGTVAAQFGGIFNTASKVNGVQFGGILNIAGEINGAQFGGILNIAKKLNGVQFGLFNYAEDSNGVSIGLINIVKNGGKHEFEVSFSEAITTTINFKLGTDKFYTIFSGGIKYLPISSIEYATGLGFGTHIDWANGWGNQIELITHSVTADGKYPIHFINNIHQLKLTISKEFAKYFKIFAGPVLNLAVSNYRNPQTAEFASLAPWSMWKTSIRGIQLESWVGFSVGVRF